MVKSSYEQCSLKHMQAILRLLLKLYITPYENRGWCNTKIPMPNESTQIPLIQSSNWFNITLSYWNTIKGSSTSNSPTVLCPIPPPTLSQRRPQCNFSLFLYCKKAIHYMTAFPKGPSAHRDVNHSHFHTLMMQHMEQFRIPWHFNTLSHLSHEDLGPLHKHWGAGDVKSLLKTLQT